MILNVSYHLLVLCYEAFLTYFWNLLRNLCFEKIILTCLFHLCDIGLLSLNSYFKRINWSTFCLILKSKIWDSSRRRMCNNSVWITFKIYLENFSKLLSGFHFVDKKRLITLWHSFLGWDGLIVRFNFNNSGKHSTLGTQIGIPNVLYSCSTSQ